MEPFLLAILVFAVLYVGVGWFFSSKVIIPEKYDHDYAIEFDKGRGRVDETYFELFQTMEKTEVIIPSKYGYELYGLWVPFKDAQGIPAKRTIVFCHGITWNLIGSVKYSEIFYKMGFNMLLYDHRNHGKSGGSKTTFGYFEKEDLKLWFDWIEKELGEGAYIATHGESLGAATVLQHLAIDSRVKFCIADCPYSDLSQLLKYRLEQEYNIRRLPLLPIAGFIMKLRTGMRLKAVSPLEAIKGVETPIFWIHGLADNYVPFSMSKDMYDAKLKGIRKLWLVENAKHANAYFTDREGYYRQVDDFIKAL